MQDLFEALREAAEQQQPQAAAAMEQQPFVFSPRERREAAERSRAAAAGSGEGLIGVTIVHGSSSSGSLTAAGDKEEDGEEAFMQDYFNKVQILKRALHEIAVNIQRVRQLQQHVVAASSPDAERDASHVLNKLLDGTSVMMQKATKALQRLREENAAFAAAAAAQKNKREGDSSSSELRIRQNMHQILARQLQQLLLDCQQVETDCKALIKRRVIRQVQIVYPEASKQEVEELVEAGDLSAAAAVKMRVAGTHQTLTNAVADLQDKYRDVLRLEQSVTELHQMFVELALLVDQQGELLDQIEYNVTQAKDYTEKGEKELLQARKNQETAKKRMCWLSVCVLVLIVIILVPVILTLLK